MGRYKSLIGPRLRARGFTAQQTEAAIGVAVLNRMLATGRPDSVRRQPVAAWQLGVWGYLALRLEVHQCRTEQNGLDAQNALHPPARTRVFDQIFGNKMQ
jgi:hypothetical protein